MHTRPLGPDGPLVSALGIGAMSFSDFYGETTDAASFAILDTAQELGITAIDTSNVYGMGRSETVIGAYLKERGARDKFHIATKAGIGKDAQGNRGFNNDAKYLEDELDKSLTRLGIEQVDLFYVHRREAARPIEEVTQTLVRLIEKGKIASFGFSEIAPTSLTRAAAIHPVAAVQSEYSLATRYAELGLSQTCARLGTTLVAFSPVGRGLLSDAPPDAAKREVTPFMQSNPRFSEDALPRNIQATDALRALAADMGLPTAGLAMAWLLAQGQHIHPIPGTRSVQHLRDLATGADVSLSPDDLARIETALPVGSIHGDRYGHAQWVGVEKYC